MLCSPKGPLACPHTHALGPNIQKPLRVALVLPRRLPKWKRQLSRDEGPPRLPDVSGVLVPGGGWPSLLSPSFTEV